MGNVTGGRVRPLSDRKKSTPSKKRTTTGKSIGEEEKHLRARGRDRLSKGGHCLKSKGEEKGLRPKCTGAEGLASEKRLREGNRAGGDR